MIDDASTVQHLATVISQIAAPAFLLSAEAELLAVIIARKDRIVDRARLLTGKDGNGDRLQAKPGELSWLKQRAILLHRSVYCSAASAMLTSLLVITAFATAFLGYRHEYGAGLLFVMALGLFVISLVYFAREVHISASEVDF
jgi:hypothetical protein